MFVPERVLYIEEVNLNDAAFLSSVLHFAIYDRFPHGARLLAVCESQEKADLIVKAFEALRGLGVENLVMSKISKGR